VRLVRTGPKVDYCLRDLVRSHGIEQLPEHAGLPGVQSRPAYSTDVLGTSAGWSDVYPYEYPQQWIDVTDCGAVSPTCIAATAPDARAATGGSAT